VNSSAASSRHSRRHHDGRAGSAKAPVAHANPLVHRESATPQQGTQPSGSSGSGSSPVAVPDTSPVTSNVTPKVPSAPSVPSPDTLLKSSPVTLPGGATLPVELPLNTAAVSGVVDTLLGH
jgi:hypothetical protein